MDYGVRNFGNYNLLSNIVQTDPNLIRTYSIIDICQVKGFLYQDFNYAKGQLNGMAIYYSRKTGDLIKKGPFKDDLRVGTWENYVDGELVSTEQPALKPERD